MSAPKRLLSLLALLASWQVGRCKVDTLEDLTRAIKAGKAFVAGIAGPDTECASGRAIKRTRMLSPFCTSIREQEECETSYRTTKSAGMQTIIPCLWDTGIRKCRDHAECATAPGARQSATRRRRFQGDDDCDWFNLEEAFDMGRSCDIATCDNTYITQKMGNEFFRVPCREENQACVPVSDCGVPVEDMRGKNDTKTRRPKETPMPTPSPVTLEPTAAPTVFVTKPGIEICPALCEVMSMSPGRYCPCEREGKIVDSCPTPIGDKTYCYEYEQKPPPSKKPTARRTQKPKRTSPPAPQPTEEPAADRITFKVTVEKLLPSRLTEDYIRKQTTCIFALSFNEVSEVEITCESVTILSVKRVRKGRGNKRRLLNDDEPEFEWLVEYDINLKGDKDEADTASVDAGSWQFNREMEQRLKDEFNIVEDTDEAAAFTVKNSDTAPIVAKQDDPVDEDEKPSDNLIIYIAVATGVALICLCVVFYFLRPCCDDKASSDEGDRYNRAEMVGPYGVHNDDEGSYEREGMPMTGEATRL